MLIEPGAFESQIWCFNNWAIEGHVNRIINWVEYNLFLYLSIKFDGTSPLKFIYAFKNVSKYSDSYIYLDDQRSVYDVKSFEYVYK